MPGYLKSILTGIGCNHYFLLLIFNILLTVTFLALYGCQRPDERKPYVAVVKGEKIYLVDFQERWERELGLSADDLKRKSLKPLREEVLGNLIDEKIMLLRARELSLRVTDEELMLKIEEIKKDYSADQFALIFSSNKVNYDVWREALRRRVLLEKVIAADVNSRVSVTDDEARTYFKRYWKSSASGKMVHALQIVSPDRVAAEKTLKRLKRGEDFRKVAKEVSVSPEADTGGDLGFFSSGVMPEVIDKVVFSLPVGKISWVVKSPYGYHIFKVIERDEGGRKNFFEVKDRIAKDLRKQKEAAEYIRWLEDLRKKAVIIKHDEIFDQKM